MVRFLKRAVIGQQQPLVPEDGASLARPCKSEGHYVAR